MKRVPTSALAPWWLLAATAACSVTTRTDRSSCKDGETVSCACPDGTSSRQSCHEDGTLGECECGATRGGGTAGEASFTFTAGGTTGSVVSSVAGASHVSSGHSTVGGVAGAVVSETSGNGAAGVGSVGGASSPVGGASTRGNISAGGVSAETSRKITGAESLGGAGHSGGVAAEGPGGRTGESTAGRPGADTAGRPGADTAGRPGGAGASINGSAGAPCASGTQDNDHNGMCSPSCASATSSCPLHSTCSDASGSVLCTCVTGYVAGTGGCVWGTLPEDPGFRGSPVGSWVPSAGATLAPASEGAVDIGNMVFDRKTICEGNGSASQTVTMPTFEQAEPMQLEFSAQRSCLDSLASCGTGRMDVFFNGAAMSFSVPTAYSTQTRCLGERAFGVTSPLIVRHGRRGSACTSSVSSYTVSVDHVQIRPNQACPKPRTIANADFEDSNNWIGYGNGTSALVAGAGVDASQGWRLQTTAGSCVNAAVRGEYSWPMVGGTALALNLNGTVGKKLTFGDPGGAVWAEFIAPGRTYACQTICVPEYAKGMVHTLEIRTGNLPNGGACADGDARVFDIDNLSLVTSPDCPADASLVDPGFELSNNVVNYWALSLPLDKTPEFVSAAIVTDAAAARSGTRFLALTTRQACTSAMASTALSVPASASGRGPALKFFYTLSSNNGSAQVTVPGASTSLTPQSTYAEQMVCLDPAAAGEGLWLHIRLSGAKGDSESCDSAFPEVRAHFDDFQVTTDSSCPTQ